MASRREVERALAEVPDPEYPLTLAEMGMIREVKVEDATAHVAISYCSLGCPCISLIEHDVRERLLKVTGISRVEIEESFDHWTRADITRRGLASLRQAGVA